MKIFKIIRIKFGKLRYTCKNRLFEEIKDIVYNLMRFFTQFYTAENKGTTIFVIGQITGIDVDLLENIVSDLILENLIYESNPYEYRVYQILD